MTSEVYIQSNIPLIILIIIVICIFIYGYLEFKKLSILIDSLNNKINIINNKFSNIYEQQIEQIDPSLQHQNKQPETNSHNNLPHSFNLSSMEYNLQKNIHENDNKSDFSDNINKNLESTDDDNYSYANSDRHSDHHSDRHREHHSDNDSDNHSDHHSDHHNDSEHHSDNDSDHHSDNNNDNNDGNNDGNKGENDDKDENDIIHTEEFKKITKYNGYSINELKLKCKELKLHYSGNKSTLIKRIIDYEK